jgi:hypothetical protein
VQRRTSMHGIVSYIPYFVDSRFASTVGKSPRDLYYVEVNVEGALHRGLQEKCQSETNYKTDQITRARSTRNQNAIDAATALETPACVLKQELEAKKAKFS